MEDPVLPMQLHFPRDLLYEAQFADKGFVAAWDDEGALFIEHHQVSFIIDAGNCEEGLSHLGNLVGELAIASILQFWGGGELPFIGNGFSPWPYIKLPSN